MVIEYSLGGVHFATKNPSYHEIVAAHSNPCFENILKTRNKARCVPPIDKHDNMWSKKAMLHPEYVLQYSRHLR